MGCGHRSASEHDHRETDDGVRFRFGIRTAASRIPIPVDRAGFSMFAGVAPRLAFDSESRLLAVATAESLSLFSVPDGTPLISEAKPAPEKTPPGQPPHMGMDLTFAMPTGLLFAPGARRLFSAVHPSDLNGMPTAMQRSGIQPFPLGQTGRASHPSVGPGTPEDQR